MLKNVDVENLKMINISNKMRLIFIINYNITTKGK